MNKKCRIRIQKLGTIIILIGIGAIIIGLINGIYGLIDGNVITFGVKITGWVIILWGVFFALIGLTLIVLLEQKKIKENHGSNNHNSA